MPTVRFQCPKCKRIADVDQRLVGRKGRCISCKHVFTIKTYEAPQRPPLTWMDDWQPIAEAVIPSESVIDGRWEIRASAAGRRGMVYEAMDLSTGKFAVLKGFNQMAVQKPGWREQLQSLACRWLALSPMPFASTLVGVSNPWNEPMLITERYGGGSLRHQMKRGLSPANALALVAAVAAAITRAHDEAGVAHLGLTPGNVLLTEKARVRLDDWYVADWAQRVIGYPHHVRCYRAPEQFRDDVPQTPAFVPKLTTSKRPPASSAAAGAQASATAPAPAEEELAPPPAIADTADETATVAQTPDSATPQTDDMGAESLEPLAPPPASEVAVNDAVPVGDQNPEAPPYHGPANYRADIYALGVVLYEVLAARLPFKLDDDNRSLDELVHPRMFRPELPRKLGKLLFACLDPNPANRPERMWEVQHYLLDVVEANYNTQLNFDEPIQEPFALLEEDERESLRKLNSEPMAAEALRDYRQAQVCLTMGDQASAERAIDPWIDRAPELALPLKSKIIRSKPTGLPPLAQIDELLAGVGNLNFVASRLWQEKAHIHHFFRQPDEAVRCLREARNLFPQKPSLATEQAEMMLALDDARSAVAGADDAISACPKWALPHELRAVTLMQVGGAQGYQQAMRSARQAVELMPQHAASAWSTLLAVQVAILGDAAGQFDENHKGMLKIITSSIARLCRRPEQYAALMSAYAKPSLLKGLAGAWYLASAISVASAWQRQFPEDGWSWAARALVLQQAKGGPGEDLIPTGLFGPDANACVEQATKLRLDGASAWAATARALAELKIDAQRAHQAADKAAEIDEDLPDIWLAKANAAAMEQDASGYALNSERYFALTSPQPAAELWLAEGNRLARAGEGDLANIAWEQTLRHDETSLAAQLNLGLLAGQRMQLDAAVQHAAKALQLAPDDLRALRLSADCHRLKGDKRKARKAYERLITASNDPNIARYARDRIRNSGVFAGKPNLSRVPRKDRPFGGDCLRLLADPA